MGEVLYPYKLLGELTFEVVEACNEARLLILDIRTFYYASFRWEVKGLQFR